MVQGSTVSLRGLRTFCVAARHESFRAAAAELNITPSAVSHQVKNIEVELGERLFERTARELHLTSAGQSIYNEIEPLIAKIDAVVGAYKTSATRATVRLSVQPFFASEYLMPRLGEFTTDHPDIDIQVGASDESAENFVADVDLAVRLYKRAPDGVESTPLMPLRLAVAGSASMARSLRVEDRQIVSPFSVIQHESMPTVWSQWSAASGIAVPASARVTRVDSMIAAVRAVEQGIGAALVPVPISDQWFAQGTITRLFAEDVVTDLSYYVVRGTASRQKPAVDLLRDWIIARLAA